MPHSREVVAELKQVHPPAYNLFLNRNTAVLDRGPWTLPQPWTRRRAHRCLDHPQTDGPTAPTGTLLVPQALTTIRSKRGTIFLRQVGNIFK